MTTTAGGEGAAGPVTALTGPPLAPAQEAALVLMEVAATDERVTAMETKTAKAERHAAELAQAAADGLAEARADADAAMERAAAVFGAEPGQIRELATAVAAEHTRHARALGKLAASLGGEG